MKAAGESSSDIDIKTLAESIHAELSHTASNIGVFQKCSIYRVPKLLREGNEHAYTPTAVSIGPYHHKDERLRSKEHCKLEYLKSLLRKIHFEEIQKKFLTSVLEAIIEKENEIRWAYAEHIDLERQIRWVRFQLKQPNFETNNINEELLGLDFDVDKGILTIPRLRTEDPTQSVYKNMIALEQTVYLHDATTHLTDYFYFLDCLINTPKDVQLLADAEIIDNRLGNEVLCDMFNTISKNTHVVPWRYSYAGVSKKLDDHCKKSWNHYKATLRDKYRKNPLAVISLFYATILLLLTAVQVITGILAVPGVLGK